MTITVTLAPFRCITYGRSPSPSPSHYNNLEPRTSNYTQTFSSTTQYTIHKFFSPLFIIEDKLHYRHKIFINDFICSFYISIKIPPWLNPQGLITPNRLNQRVYNLNCINRSTKRQEWNLTTQNGIKKAGELTQPTQRRRWRRRRWRRRRYFLKLQCTDVIMDWNRRWKTEVKKQRWTAVFW